MPNLWAALVCATGLWIIGTLAAMYEVPKHPVGEAWVVTSSDKIPSRPMLVRAAVPYTVAAR